MQTSQKKSYLSLKTKILAGLVVLLLVTVIFNLLYSYNLFVDDKVSYIFEAGLRQAEALSDQLNFKSKELDTLTSLQDNAELTENEFKNIVAKNDELLAIGKVEKDGNIVKVFINQALVSRLASKKVFNFDLLPGPSVIIPNTIKLNHFEILKINTNVNAYVYLTKKNVNSYNFFLTTTDSIDSIFKSNSLFNNLYLNLDSSDKKFLKLTEAIKKFPGLKGTLEFKKNGDDQLVSFVKMNNSKLAIISLIASNKAFQVTKNLINQTMLFGFFLLGILIAIGVFFSASLTEPILKLTKLAEGISKRDFSQKFIITTSDEISILGNTFNHMGSEIESLLMVKEEMIKELEAANLKLEDYSRNLETMVEQRTFELKEAHHFMGAMVDSLDQGLMVFDSELKCHDIHTIACEKLFDINPKGNTFIDILGINEENEIESVKDWAKILFSEMIPFESAISLGPKEKITGLNVLDTNYKNILLNYYPMRNDEEAIQNVVVVATDKTQEIQFLEAANQKQAYVNMVIKILSNKSQFQSFISEVYKILDQLPKCINLKSTSIDFESAMMNFHTLNGGFGLFHLLSLQKLAIQYEGEIIKIKSEKIKPQGSVHQFLLNVEKMRFEFTQTIKDLDEKLRSNFTKNVQSKEIELSKIKIVKEHLDQSDIHNAKNLFEEYFVKEPVLNFFQAYHELVKTISKNAGKNINGITFENENLRINQDYFQEFFNVLVHLFRNCVDHGIETEAARLKLGKTPEGNINVSFGILKEDKKTALSVIVRDDGAGINPEKIRAKLRTLFPNENFDSLLENELINKIFSPSFSTSEEGSTLSGRGIGMSAISEVVSKMNGNITIETKVGIGTSFNFVIPIV